MCVVVRQKIMTPTIMCVLKNLDKNMLHVRIELTTSGL